MSTSKTQTKPVWDIAVRIFHWSLVAGFTTAYLTGEEEGMLHIYAGYMILGLLVFRMVWGVIGSRHARFTDFVYSPARIVGYAKNMFAGKPDHYDGHNPLGSLMVFALLISLVLTTVSGLKVYGAEGHGPLATNTNYSEMLISSVHASSPENAVKPTVNKKSKHYWEEIHEFFANLTVLLVVLHVGGVVLSSRLEKQNLVKAMITGRKQTSSPD